MIDYILNMLDDITEEMKWESATPASHYLFGISEDTTKISYKLLYLSNRARPDIQIESFLLYTRVRGPETDD